MNLQQVKNTDRIVNECGLGTEQNLEAAASLENIQNARAAQVDIKPRTKKGKVKFSLFAVYSETVASLKQGEIVISEYVEMQRNGLPVLDEEGKAKLNDAGKTFELISAEAKELLTEARTIFAEVAGEADRIKADWIADKVLTNRYSRRGFQIVCEFNDLADSIFTLNSICVSIQATLFNTVSKMEQTASE